MKRLISAAISLALLLSLLSVSVNAGRSTKINVPNTDALIFNILDAKKWDKVSSVSSFKNTDERALIVYPDTESKKTSMTFSHTFDDAVPFDKINEICLETRVASEHEAFTVKISAYGKNGVYSDTTEGVCGTRNSLYFKFPELVKDEIVKIQFTVTAGNELPETCTVFSVYADSAYSYSYIDLYDTVRFNTVSGTVDYREKSVRILSSGTSALDAHLSTEPSEGGVSIVLSISSSSAGIVHIESINDSKKYQTALYSGTNDYIFFLDTAPESIRIGFTHGEGSGNAQIVLNSMNVTNLNKTKYENLGAINTCEYTDGNINIKGSVSSDTAVRFIDSKIGLYRVSLDGEWESEPLKQINISTVFELSVREDRNTSMQRYGVAIIAEDGIHPLTEPMFASSYMDSSKPYSNTTVGLLNPSSFDAFKANTSTVVLDVWAGNLLANNSSSNTALYPFNDNLYSIDKTYYSSITHDIAFYKNLGCSVYLRVNVADDNTYNEHTMKNLQAVLSYIASNADGISGFMLMPDYPAEDYNISSASYAALTLGCLSETVRTISPEYEIYYCVPEGSNVFAAHLAHFTKLYGLEGISALYNAKNDNDVTMMRPSIDSASFDRVFLTVGNINTCKAVFETAAKAKVYSVIVDAKNGINVEEFKQLNNKEDIYSELTSEADIKGHIPLWDFRDNYSTFGFISGGNISAPQTVKSADGRVLRATLEKSSGVLLCKIGSELNLIGANGVSIDLSTTSNADMELIIGYSNSRKIYTTAALNGKKTLYAPIEGNGKIEYIALAFTGDKGMTVDISTIGVYSSTLDNDQLESSIKNTDSVLQRQTTTYYIIGGGALVLTAVIFILLTKKKDDKEKASE